MPQTLHPPHHDCQFDQLRPLCTALHTHCRWKRAMWALAKDRSRTENRENRFTRVHVYWKIPACGKTCNRRRRGNFETRMLRNYNA